MITFKHQGDFSKTFRFLEKAPGALRAVDFDRFGKEGVAALVSATPSDSGETAAAWDYTVSKGAGSVEIAFSNSNVNNGFPIAIGLQYGHGTGTGGYVQGRDYINPAIQPIFDRLSNELWKVVTGL